MIRDESLKTTSDVIGFFMIISSSSTNSYVVILNDMSGVELNSNIQYFSVVKFIVTETFTYKVRITLSKGGHPLPASYLNRTHFLVFHGKQFRQISQL